MLNGHLNTLSRHEIGTFVQKLITDGQFGFSVLAKILKAACWWLTLTLLLWWIDSNLSRALSKQWSWNFAKFRWQNWCRQSIWKDGEGSVSPPFKYPPISAHGSICVSVLYNSITAPILISQFDWTGGKNVYLSKFKPCAGSGGEVMPGTKHRQKL